MAAFKRWLMARKWVIEEVLQVQAPDTSIPGGGQLSPHTLHVSYVFGDDGWHLYTWEADGPHVDDQGEIVDGDDATIHGDRDFAYPGQCDNGIHDGEPTSDPPEWVVDLARQRAAEHPAPPPFRPEAGPEVVRPPGLDDLLNYVADNLPDPQPGRCSAAVMGRPHLPHEWEPQPGMDPVRCPGVPFDEETEAQVVGRVLGLTDEQIGWLHTAHLACERLNESLEKSNSPHRWRALSSGDPRRVKKERKL